MTILSRESAIGGDILASSWSLKTATGDYAEVYGETVATFLIGETSFQHRALVANIDEDVILGTDIMTKFGFLMDLKKGVVVIGREEVVLHHGKDLTARLVLGEDTTFPELSQTIARAHLDKDVPEGQGVILEPETSDGTL